MNGRSGVPDVLPKKYEETFEIPKKNKDIFGIYRFNICGM